MRRGPALDWSAVIQRATSLARAGEALWDRGYVWSRHRAADYFEQAAEAYRDAYDLTPEIYASTRLMLRREAAGLLAMAHLARDMPIAELNPQLTLN